MLARALLVFVLPIALLLAAAIHRAEPPTPPAHHLVKIDSRGGPMPAWSGPWACVCDTRTNLLWEVKTDDEGIHDGDWTYSWWQGNTGVANNGDCYYEQNRCDTADLVRHTRREALCGVENWRLPSAAELKTLRSVDTPPGAPAIDGNYFPKTRRGDYWTHDAEQPLDGVYAYLRSGSAAINFIDGDQVTIPYRNAAFARLVAPVSKGCHRGTQ